MSKVTLLKCSRRQAHIVILLIAFLFILIGCGALLRSSGVAPEEVAKISAEFKEDLSAAVTAGIADITTAIAEGQDLKTAAIRTTTSFIWKIATAGASVLGVALSSLLGKWLKTERKITTALIKGIEKKGSPTTKTAVYKQAMTAGIEKTLSKRVANLT